MAASFAMDDDEFRFDDTWTPPAADTDDTAGPLARSAETGGDTAPAAADPLSEATPAMDWADDWPMI
jgi:hypothetical protein